MGKKEKEEMNDGNAAEKKRNDWGLTCSAFERHVNTRARAHTHMCTYSLWQDLSLKCVLVFFSHIKRFLFSYFFLSLLI